MTSYDSGVYYQDMTYALSVLIGSTAFFSDFTSVFASAALARLGDGPLFSSLYSNKRIGRVAQSYSEILVKVMVCTKSSSHLF